MRQLKTKTGEKIFFAPKGYGCDKRYTDSLPKTEPKPEKEKKEPVKRKLSAKTIQIGELWMEGKTIAEIAEIMKIKAYSVEVKIEVFERYN